MGASGTFLVQHKQRGQKRFTKNLRQMLASSRVFPSSSFILCLMRSAPSHHSSRCANAATSDVCLDEASCDDIGVAAEAKEGLTMLCRLNDLNAPFSSIDFVPR